MAEMICAKCGSPAEFIVSEGLYRHKGEPHQKEYIGQTFCDRYGYPIPVRETSEDIRKLVEAARKLIAIDSASQQDSQRQALAEALKPFEQPATKEST